VPPIAGSRGRRFDQGVGVAAGMNGVGLGVSAAIWWK
jgi:hypothetical protein